MPQKKEAIEATTIPCSKTVRDTLRVKKAEHGTTWNGLFKKFIKADDEGKI